MENQTDRQDSIVNRILDGSVRIETEKEFHNILKIFPNEPKIHRAFADMLSHKKSMDAAAASYEKSVDLFIDSGRILSAIVAKILKWRIQRPVPNEGRIFHSAIHGCKIEDRPLNRFLSGLTYPEFVPLMMKMVLCRFAAGTVIKKPGDIENAVFFIVNGAVSEASRPQGATSQDADARQQKDLTENEFFGNIYPFGAENIAQEEVRAITGVELIKISKIDLMNICRKCPELELKLSDLYKSRIDGQDNGTGQTVRKTLRHQIPTRVVMKVFGGEKASGPLSVEGFADDISLGGACVVLGAKYWTGSADQMVDKNAKLEIVLSNAANRLMILGKIVWGRHISLEGKTSAAVGVQFLEMTDHDRQLLNDYCNGSEGEQNLIWSLWESMVKK